MQRWYNIVSFKFVIQVLIPFWFIYSNSNYILSWCDECGLCWFALLCVLVTLFLFNKSFVLWNIFNILIFTYDSSYTSNISSQQEAPGLCWECVRPPSQLNSVSLLCCQFTAHFNSASLFLTPPTDIDKCIVTIATPQYISIMCAIVKC